PLERWLPLEVTQGSRPLMLFAGLALLQVTRALSRRKQLAWYVASIALGVSLFLHVTRGFDLHHSLVAALLLAYLVAFRRRFYARSDPASMRRGLWMAPVLELAVFLYGYVGLSQLEDQFRWQALAGPAGQGLVAYATRGSVALACGDPLAPEEELERAAREYLDHCVANGWIACVYEAAEARLPVYHRLGLRSLKMAEEALLDLGEFNLS